MFAILQTHSPTMQQVCTPPQGWRNDWLSSNKTDRTEYQTKYEDCLIITTIIIIRSSYIIFLSTIMVNNKENKDEEFLSFLCLSVGLFFSGVSGLTPNPGRLWDVTNFFVLFINMHTASFIHFTLHPGLVLSPLLQKISSTKNMCNSSCISGRNLAHNVQKTNQFRYSYYPISHFSAQEGTQRGMS